MFLDKLQIDEQHVIYDYSKLTRGTSRQISDERALISQICNIPANYLLYNPDKSSCYLMTDGEVEGEGSTKTKTQPQIQLKKLLEKVPNIFELDGKICKVGVASKGNSKNILEEFQIIQKFHQMNPHFFPQVYDVLLCRNTKDKNECYLGMTMEKLVTDYNGHTFNINKFATDILTALKIMHSNNISHSDIKPSNICKRESDNSYVLIDFGCYQILDFDMHGQGTLETPITDSIYRRKNIRKNANILSDLEAFCYTLAFFIDPHQGDPYFIYENIPKWKPTDARLVEYVKLLSTEDLDIETVHEKLIELFRN